jgi:hypothetical protein
LKSVIIPDTLSLFDTLDDKIEALIDNKMTAENFEKTKLENNERVSGIITDFKSLEEIVKNLTNENNQLKDLTL